ncbi:MAG: DUF1566 domain-containing protein [Gallionellaceae bacterium]
MRSFVCVLLLTAAGLSSAWADPRFVIRGAEVYDAQMKLTWARCSVGQEWKEGHCTGTIGRFSFEEAQKQANGEWRVPTKDELVTLIDPDRKSFPTIDTAAFPDMDVLFPWYWSSTPNGATIAWYVDFADGYSSGFISMSSPFSVRLVRDSH